MRQMISGLVAAVAVVAAGAAPAMACGGGLFSNGCSPCQAYVSPCAQSYGAGYGVAGYERLPSPTQYYYVNQGPTYTGPGSFAPVPTYQESAVSGWGAYSRPYYYPYDGGRYANPMHHYYDGARVAGPSVYSYRWHHRYHRWHQPRPYYGMHRPSIRYGYAPRNYGYAPRYSHAPRHYGYAPRRYTPRVIYGSRHYGSGAHYGHRHPVLRRYY
ncbi:MAG: hypothetical protein JSS22_02705 [Proteobacteria bacterium]|nr:hypothetical protein [Pseudomonadota bacterium]